MKFIVNKHSSVIKRPKNNESLEGFDISCLSNLSNIQTVNSVTNFPKTNITLSALEISSLSNLANKQTRDFVIKQEAGDFLRQENPRILVRSNNSWEDIADKII